VTNNQVTLFGVGDVSPIHEPIGAYSALIRSTLAAADIRFCAAERPYSDRGTAQPWGAAEKPVSPSMASIFTDCGFDVVSVASNHTMDWGAEALLDTIHILRKRGIKVIGAGEDLEEACQPAFVECKGVKTAFLSFCSVIREGCEAGSNKPGIAPLRAHSRYESNYQPGVPPRIITVPYEDDLAAMKKHIASAKQKSDAVVLSLHWGVPFIPRLIASYQPIVAEAAFAAGADIILGHHAHVPKAVGVYSGKVCFYSLGNFIITSNFLGGDPLKISAFEQENGIKIDPDYPLLPYGQDAKRSLISKAVLSRKGIERVSFLPLLLDKQIRPEQLRSDDARFRDNLEFMEWVSEYFPHKFAIDGDEVVVSPP